MTEDLDQSIIHDNALPVGTRLNKHYVIEKLLGHGAFGLVYLARDESLARLVAIKEYLPEQLATRIKDNIVSPHAQSQPLFDECRENFTKEAKQIAHFEHPAIVKVMYTFDANNTAYMVMPYYTGESLKRVQKRTNKRWNEAELRVLLEPLLNALELLHQQNILHRDIAPDNIFIKDNGQPILLDFGSARQIESEYTLSLNLQYKRGYSPIELYTLGGKTQAGSWTDIYSLAAVVYELATGEKVHEAPKRASDDQMSSLKECHPAGLTANFIASIDFALAIKGKNRPQSIKKWRECMKTGKQVASNTKLTPVSFNFKNHQRLLVALGSGLLIIVLAYGLLTSYKAWSQQSAWKDEKNRRDTEEQNRQVDFQRLDPVVIQGAIQAQVVIPTPIPLEPIQLEKRLGDIIEAKAQLNGSDKTLWQAAVILLESLEPLDGEAMFLLGASYIKGVGGIKKDENRGCQWMKKAADAGNQKGKQYADSQLCKKY